MIINEQIPHRESTEKKLVVFELTCQYTKRKGLWELKIEMKEMSSRWVINLNIRDKSVK